MTNNIITAKVARALTVEKHTQDSEQILERIFEDGIFPAIKKGHYMCVFHMYRKGLGGKRTPIISQPIPIEVLDELRRLGYTVEYAKVINNNKSSVTKDLSLIRIEW